MSSFTSSENSLTDQKLYEYISKEHVVPQLLIVEYSSQQYQSLKWMETISPKRKKRKKEKSVVSHKKPAQTQTLSFQEK